MNTGENDSATAARERAAEDAEQQTRARISFVTRRLRQAAYEKHRDTVLELSKVRATCAADENPFDVQVAIQVRDAYMVADILDVVTRSPLGVVEQLAVAIAKIEELEKAADFHARACTLNDERVRELRKRGEELERQLKDALKVGIKRGQQLMEVREQREQLRDLQREDDRHIQQRIETPCPTCGNRTLFIGAGGHLTCSWLKCVEPGVERAVNQAREHLSAFAHDVVRAVAVTCEEHRIYVARDKMKGFARKLEEQDRR